MLYGVSDEVGSRTARFALCAGIGVVRSRRLSAHRNSRGERFSLFDALQSLSARRVDLSVRVSARRRSLRRWGPCLDLRNLWSWSTLQLSQPSGTDVGVAV